MLSLEYFSLISIYKYLSCFSGVIDEKPLRFRGEVYHGYHFNCTSCGVELNSDARELKHRSGYTANEMVKNINIEFELRCS